MQLCHAYTFISFIQTSLLLSIQYITNLASCFGALSQTTLRVSIREETFDVLVLSPFSCSTRRKTCPSSLYAFIHLNNTWNSSSIEPSLHIGHKRSCRFKPDILPNSIFLVCRILIVPHGTVLQWLSFFFMYSSTTMLVLILLYRRNLDLLATLSFHFRLSYKLIYSNNGFSLHVLLFVYTDSRPTTSKIVLISVDHLLPDWFLSHWNIYLFSLVESILFQKQTMCIHCQDETPSSTSTTIAVIP